MCVRETRPADDGEYVRFGVAVATNTPGIGVFCPFVSENGSVATQHYTVGEVGPRLLGYLDDGLRADDAVAATLAAVSRPHLRQVHALCREARGVHHGDAPPVYGDRVGERYSVAGNTLAGEGVLDAIAAAFERGDPDRELAVRLIEALAAGEEAGGDRRDDDVRSAAVRVVDPGAPLANEWYNDLRVDASRTPIADLTEQYGLAKDYHAEAAAEW
ncbi:DUF1028 domain-containing protein [Halomarina pelagica]|uniref:DUF1028 domain-containing protein n=1 Tax=Halomarina pelagica TaxID=2961599 RepID=UPI0020C52803|nr:DUF1028 domain-containing protein [Halomarina sp. BND7]